MPQSLRSQSAGVKVLWELWDKKVITSCLLGTTTLVPGWNWPERSPSRWLWWPIPPSLFPIEIYQSESREFLNPQVTVPLPLEWQCSNRDCIALHHLIKLDNWKRCYQIPRWIFLDVKNKVFCSSSSRKKKTVRLPFWGKKSTVETTRFLPPKINTTVLLQCQTGIRNILGAIPQIKSSHFGFYHVAWISPRKEKWKWIS